MPTTNETITTVHDLLNYDASHFLSAEVQLKNILPYWIQAVGFLKLKSALKKYKDHIDQHIIKMKKFFEEDKIFRFYDF
jgi:ferritin-like metal-binding protein YciE